MSNADVHLVRKAFLINYGYSPDPSHHAMMCEFLRRYDQAHALRRKNAGFHRVMLVIEGMAETLSEKEASSERELRKLKNRGVERRKRLQSDRVGPARGRIRGPSGSRVDLE